VTRFTGVRLRNGLGWVHLREGTVYPPHDGISFAAPGADEACALFCVVDHASSPGATAVLLGPKRLLVGDEVERACARHLRAAGYGTVASVRCEAPGAAVGRAYGSGEGTLEQAACAVWAAKALGGRAEAELTTVLLTHVCDGVVDGPAAPPRTHTAAWMSVRAQHGSEGWTAEVESHRGSWKALVADVALAGQVLLCDVDHTRAYHDAYGHQEGDLMLARVHACIEAAARSRGARVVRVGGEEWALVVGATGSEAVRFADDLRRGVEALHLPFSHPTVRTAGRVTVSIGVAPAEPGATLRERLEEAVDAAKRAGRNAVQVGR
jgi:diguanylate cyclase (GGDEF)-like protein